MLADLARLNCDVFPLAMQFIDDTATHDEQRDFAERLIDLGPNCETGPTRSG